ncbi:MAG: glycosyltransferase family 1 protein [bacterium]|nr:glycosyltransferase family 1 protein [bacterium]
MRLALLGSRGIPARYGGFETFAQELAPRLAERGVEVTVFCEETPGPRPLDYRGVRLEYVRAKAPGPLRTLDYDVRSLWRARRDFDVVYMLGYAAAFACFLPRLHGSECWINMDGLEWRRSKWNALARTWLWCMEAVAGHAATRLVFDNAALADDVLGRRRPRTAHSVIEYGAHPLARAGAGPLAALGLAPDAYDLTVCRAEPENHLLELIDAHEQARTTRTLVLVANTDQDNAYCAAVRARAAQRPGTRLLGPIYDPAQLAALRSHCNVYLHGHSVGGTNPSLLEAMGCGTLVCAHDNPFNREVLADAGTYFADTGALVHRLDALDALGGAERERRIQLARARVVEHYTWDLIADRYAALLGVPSSDVAAEAA